MKRATHLVIYAITAFSIMCVALLALFFGWREVRTQQAHDTASRIATQLEAQFPETGSISDDAFKRGNSLTLPDLASIPQAALGNTSYIGMISIPTRDIDLPLKYAYTQTHIPSLIGPISTLDTPQVITEVEAGRWVIEGPSYSGIFKGLANIPDGEEVSLTLLDGSTRRYFVLWAETIFTWNQAQVFDTQEPWELTLVAPSISGLQYDVLRLTHV